MSIASALSEPPGANCASGGIKVVTGVDTNGDANLAESETLHTTYVCNSSALPQFKHVLLLSVDGLHQVDLAKWIAANPNSNLAQLSKSGVTYTGARTPAPADSFPGLLALVTGGTPKSTGVYYDDSYDRTMYAPGSACAGSPGAETTYAENVDVDNTRLDAGGGIDPTLLPMAKDSLGNCSPLYPHAFLKVNTIFEVAHTAGLHTAWADKHPAYDLVNGPSGHGVDDLYTPEINSLIVNGGTVNNINLAATKALCDGTNSLPVAKVSDYTTCLPSVEAYDDVKVVSLINQIDGFTSDGMNAAQVPAIFGMNFQAVSVGEKLPVGGYLDATGTPSANLAAAILHTDASIGKLVAELKAQGHYSSTLIIVTAKHGQSPIDKSKLQMEAGGSGDTSVTDPEGVLESAVPGFGASTGFLMTDDVGIVWLTDPSTAPAAFAALQANATAIHANTPAPGALFSANLTAGAALASYFGDPTNAADTVAYARAPNIFIQPNEGTIYSGSSKKVAEHGGSTVGDTNVALLVSWAGATAATVSVPVSTTQVAPTILQALGLSPWDLKAVVAESTEVLPNLAQTPVTFSHLTDPVPAQIIGGPFNLQGNLAPGNPSVHAAAPYLAAGSGVNVSWDYCDITGGTGALTMNPTTAAPVNMQPYYFPRVFGVGNNLKGFFDWRPKDMNEAVVAATSSDGGLTWTFQQMAYELDQTCPADTTLTNTAFSNLQLDNGYGHPHQLTVGGVTRLYVLDRGDGSWGQKDASIDSLGLVVHDLGNDPTQPLAGFPSSVATEDSTGAYSPFTPTRTTGLLNPDGIVSVVPHMSPTTILYVSKIKGGDNKAPTAFPASQQCGKQPYNATGTSAPKNANHDIVTIRLATTADGLNFTDLGAVNGLNDPTTVSYTGIRYTAPNGTLIDLGGGRYGLFFAGGNCMDADSDGFHIIGYAESSDLRNWTVINGINNPIASIEPKTFAFTTGATPTTVPATTPVVGNAKSWFAGRVYSPQATLNGDNTITLTFSGYGVQSPNTDLLNYRQIGHVMLRASRVIE